MTHDFEAALKSLHDLNKSMGFINPNSHYGKHCDTVAFALNLAEIVTSEPSEGMVVASQQYIHSYDVKLIHKAMITQAIKEIEHEDC